MLSIHWALIFALVILLVLAFVASRYFSLWLRAFVTRTRISLLELVMMSLRKVDPNAIVQAQIMLVQSGLINVPTKAIEAHFLAGGDIHRVTLSLIAAHRSKIDLDWNTAAAIDLAGRDILEAVQVSVNPKVIYCPDPENGYGETLNGVSQDGIQLKVRVRVTVRTNLSQLIGGAVEPTVIARVGEAIVSAIGSCKSYRDALSDPQKITRQALAKGLDSQTSFTVVSVDIADIDVGANIGATLIVSQAEADIRIARAEAEKRRAAAIARLQEMNALTQEHKATVTLAEAQIPLAIATACRSGQLRSLEQNGSAVDLRRNQKESSFSSNHVVTKSHVPFSRQ